MPGQLFYRLAQSYYALGEYRQAIELLEQSLEFTPNELRHNRYDLSVIPSVVNRMWLVFAMVECGHFSAGIGHAKRALEIAERAEHPLSEVLGWLSIGHVLLRKGELEGAVSALERGLDLCEAGRFDLPVPGWPRPSLSPTPAPAVRRRGRNSPCRQSAMPKQMR